MWSGCGDGAVSGIDHSLALRLGRRALRDIRLRRLQRQREQLLRRAELFAVLHRAPAAGDLQDRQVAWRRRRLEPAAFTAAADRRSEQNRTPVPNTCIPHWNVTKTSGVKLGQIPPRSTTSSNRPSQLRSGTFLMGSTTLYGLGLGLILSIFLYA